MRKHRNNPVQRHTGSAVKRDDDAELKALRGGGVSVNVAQQAANPNSGEHRMSSEDGEINQGAVCRSA